MALNSQTARTQPKREQSPMPSQRPQGDPVSLVGPPAQVPQLGPTPDIVIGKVQAKAKSEPSPTPVATYGDDGSITIK